ncbi:MAG: hypothetical protein LBR32_02490 [Propionibacteriaceae bacterium]|jgi:predicted  nucleic acid-binding Zn-ribbon protein|nr:hypothetical protein [Propionibacteriaceae bacterium]
MKAAPAAQLLLLDVQARDTAIAQAEHKRKTLPEHEAIADGQKRRAKVMADLVAADTQVGDLEGELARAEADLAPVRERKARDERRIADGAADPKALNAMIDEVAHLGRRIGELEDAQLDVMERLEAATAAREELRAEKSRLEDELRSAMKSREAKSSQLQAAIDEEQAERDRLAADVPADLLALYDRIRARSGGLGAARLVGRRCEGCQIEANASAMADYQAAADDDVVRCEECERILVRGAA